MENMSEGIAANTDGAKMEPQHGEGNPNMPPVEHRPTEEEKLARAKANGYKEAPEMSREDRAKAIVAALEHAIQHNAPVTLAMVAEVRDLLGVVAEEDKAEMSEADKAKAAES